MGAKQWQDWTQGLLGAWLVASPWALGFATQEGAAPTAWILGMALLALAAIAVSRPRAWEELLNIVLGVGLLVSPWARNYTELSRATSNAVIVGLLVTFLAVWAMVMNTTVQRWWQEHWPMH